MFQLSFLLGAIVTLEGQLLIVYIKDKLDLNEPIGVQLNQATEQIFSSSKLEPLLQSSEYRKSPECPEKIKYEVRNNNNLFGLVYNDIEHANNYMKGQQIRYQRQFRGYHPKPL